MKLIDYFDRICVIFLPERTDRVKQFEKQLSRLGIETSDIIWFPGEKYAEAAGFPKSSVRGCVMSHYTVLKQAAEDGVDKLLVFQEDCTFSSRLIKNEQTIMNQLASMHWDFAYLGHGVKMNSTPTYFIQASPDQPILLTHFCAYHKRGIPRLIQLIEDSLNRPFGHPDGGPMYFDGYMNFFRIHNPNTVTLLASPSLGRQYSSTSNLNPNQLELYKLLTPGFKLARWAKNKIRDFS